MTSVRCRFCVSPLRHTFLDLGMSPLANSYLRPENLHRMEPFYPLHVFVCERCLLVQLDTFEAPEHIFTDYAYFSSYSKSWVEHARRYSEAMIRRFNLGPEHLVVEVGSNDGYLLQHFLAAGITVLGVDPAANVAQVAVKKGIPTEVLFFSESNARILNAKGKQADLLVGNNVLAQVPNLNDFVRGLHVLLKPHGVLTMEFPHLFHLMEKNQYDTIYHEHFSYFSFATVERVFSAHQLRIFDVDRILTHGGSLRIYAQRAAEGEHPISSRIADLRKVEHEAGLDDLRPYLAFSPRVERSKQDLLAFLIEAKYQGKLIAGYGAPAKGNTLLNYCGIRRDFLEYTVDRNPHKQGLFLPGTHIPVYPPEHIRETKPDLVLILPWNLQEEIVEQMSAVHEWGGRFVVPMPEVRVLP